MRAGWSGADIIYILEGRVQMLLYGIGYQVCANPKEASLWSSDNVCRRRRHAGLLLIQFSIGARWHSLTVAILEPLNSV